MRVCFVPGPFASCTVGDTCADAFIGCVSGLVPSLVRIAGRATGVAINASCVNDATNVVGCDAIMTTQTEAYAAGLIPGTTYAVESSAVMFEPGSTLKPWEFLSPFSWGLWIAIVSLAMVITPITTALVEYKPKDTVLKNYATYLPDGVHAYAGVDTLKRTGDAYTGDSALLSVTVALVAKILNALYQCNLAAYVIYSYFKTSEPEMPRFKNVATTPEYTSAVVDASSVRVFPTQDAALASYASGSSDAVVASDAFLGMHKTCTNDVRVLDGPKVFDVLAYSSPGHTAFDLAFGKTARDKFAIVPDASCPQRAQSITLNETLGMFVAFGACIAFVSTMAVIVHVTRHEEFCASKRAPESPDSLPESVHA